MAKYLLIIMACLAIAASATSVKEVVITDFPLGVAGSVDQKIFEPYLDQLKAIADTVKLDPTIRAVVTGGADGQRYRQSHDAKNPSLALGRAHILRSLLMNSLGVDSTQIHIRTEEVKEIGPQYRYVSVRVERDPDRREIDIDTYLTGLAARVDSLEARPPVEKHFTEIQEVPLVEEDEPSDLGILFGAGVSSSPFGGIPVVTAAFTYKRIVFVEGIAGHTWWSGNEFQFMDESLDTRRRQIGGHAIIYPFEDLPVGAVGGWLRVEEMAQEFYEYSRLSEGLVIGFRVSPVTNLALTAAYNPSRHRVVTRPTSSSENDQFLIYLTVHMGIGGAR